MFACVNRTPHVTEKCLWLLGLPHKQFLLFFWFISSSMHAQIVQSVHWYLPDNLKVRTGWYDSTVCLTEMCYLSERLSHDKSKVQVIDLESNEPEDNYHGWFHNFGLYPSYAEIFKLSSKITFRRMHLPSLPTVHISGTARSTGPNRIGISLYTWWRRKIHPSKCNF
jgi:hypothetical protein